MSKPDYPVTTAVRFLREHHIDFEPHLYPYVERTILDLPVIYINGGKRGFLVAISPAGLQALEAQPVSVATEG